MTPREELKQRIHHDLGFGLYRRAGFGRTFWITAKGSGILCGTEFIPTILEIVESEFFHAAPKGMSTDFDLFRRDGDEVDAGDTIAALRGDAEILLKAERTILWALRELSGIATYTRECVNAVAGTGVALLDTRKGDALARDAHKYAVRVGGAGNHRAGLYDGIMVKDNDIAAYGSVQQALDVRIKERRFLTKVEVEVDSGELLEEVLADGRAEVIMLDNMDPDELRSAVKRIRAEPKRYVIEASGIGSHKLIDIAQTGVDAISLSSLVTKGIGNPLDLSMKR